MKTKRFQRTAAMLLCIFICAWTMFPLMGAALAAEGLHDTAEPGIACFCNTRCTADTLNADCTVCTQDVNTCTGTEPEAPTEPEISCFCDIRCTADTLNADCPVCVQEVAACIGAEPEPPTEPKPVCTCEMRCAADAPNTDCPICKQDITACIGKEPEPPTEPEPVCTCEMQCAADAPNTDCPICKQDITGCIGKEPEPPAEPVCICTAHCEPGAVNMDCPVCLLNLTACVIEAPAPVPVCVCENKCELGAVNPDCPICRTDLTGCTGKAPAPIPASNLSIKITPPSGWATGSAAAEFCITDEAGSGFTLVQVKIEKNGQWRDVTDSLKHRDNRWYGEIDLSENCTVYVCATGHDGKVYEKSRYMECFDRTAPTLRASMDGRLLRAEAKDDLSGVAAIYIDGEKYTDLTNGTLDVPLRDLPDDYEQLSVQAVDAAGNKSKIVQVKNPNYQAEDNKQKPSTGQTQPPATTAPGTTTPPATTSPTTGATTSPNTQTTTPATTTGTKPAAGTGSTKPSASASADPDEEADTTPRDPVPLTPDGQATVLDNATGEDGKEFYTIQTPDENVFYLIIDNQRDTENVYFLNAVTEADLMALAVKEDDAPQTDAIPDPEPACVCTEQCAPGEVNTDCPVCALTRKDCTGKAPVTDTETDPDEKPEKAKSGGSGTLILVLLVALAAGGAGYYFKIYKPKKDLDDAEDFDELTGGDEEETVNEDEGPDAQEEQPKTAYEEPSAYDEPEEPDYPETYDGEDD
nr:DUF4366 domain-containing protein [Anaerotruncus sp. 1XD42-93]